MNIFLFLRMCAKKNIKIQILDTSRILFNNYSWGKTSLRKIASELNISDGNLRYHFKTKEEIVLELFSRMSNEMMNEITNRTNKLEDLTIQFEQIFTIMYAYRFLFIESYFIKRTYDSYLVLFNQLEEARKLLFIEEFNRLKGENILSKDFSQEQYEMLFEQLFIISDSWIKYLKSTEKLYVTERIKYYSNLCYGLISPYRFIQN